MSELRERVAEAVAEAHKIGFCNGRYSQHPQIDMAESEQAALIVVLDDILALLEPADGRIRELEEKLRLANEYTQFCHDHHGGPLLEPAEPVAWIDLGDLIHLQAGGRGAIPVDMWDSPQRDSDVPLYTRGTDHE